MQVAVLIEGQKCNMATLVTHICESLSGGCESWGCADDVELRKEVESLISDNAKRNTYSHHSACHDGGSGGPAVSAAFVTPLPFSGGQ